MLNHAKKLLLVVSIAGLATSVTKSECLNPLDFTPLGTLNLGAGTYTINTDGAPVLRDSVGNTLFAGTTFLQGGTFGDTVSVLTFNSINIAAGANIRVSGRNPLAILSQTNITHSGLIDASGFAGADSARFGGSGAGGAGGPGAGKGGNGGGFPGQTGTGPGGGPGGPGGIGVVQGGGGGYGGKGGDSAFGTFGAPYGNLNLFLQGGSGGGGTGASAFESVGAGGGGGGGAIEFGAIGSILFSGGDLIANGGGVGAAFAANAGGGSGGGLFIHGSSVTVQSLSAITAQGGAFFGGGGRILILTSTGTITQTGGSISAGAGGGANNQQPGVVEFGIKPTAVPEPSSIALMFLGGCGILIGARRKNRSRARAS